MGLKVEHEDTCLCPLHGLLDVIARKWSLLVIAVLGNEGEKGSNELQRELKGVSAKTLSSTLKALAAYNIVKRRVEQTTTPPRVLYSLTEDGAKLRQHLIPLLKWISQKGAKKAPWCKIKLHTTRSETPAKPNQTP